MNDTNNREHGNFKSYKLLASRMKTCCFLKRTFQKTSPTPITSEKRRTLAPLPTMLTCSFKVILS